MKPPADPKIQPDPEQLRAIEHVAGPMLVVAGAGTGKTAVLVKRIARLIRQGHARADEILALTYTDNAAARMAERAQQELGGTPAHGLQVRTFHAYANELLGRAGRSFGVLDDKQLWILLRRNIRALGLNYFIRAANLSKFLDDLLDFIRRCQDELVGPAEYREYVERIEHGELPVPRVGRSKDATEMTSEEALDRCREICSVFASVERILGERNLGTFGHMIVRAYRLLDESPSILERERRRARFILIDEFQDANFAQIKLLEKLAGPSPPVAAMGDGGNVFAVGDPDQGIYRFRGASSDAFELFERSFPHARLAVLGRNRRSRTPILRCGHALIAQNPEFALGAAAAPYRRSPLVSARDEASGQAGRPALPVEVVLVSDSSLEAADLTSALIERRQRFGCEWQDMGVLYRLHSHRDEAAAELARRAIPFSIEGLDVFDTPEVRDLLAVLGAVSSPADSAALFRLAAFAQFHLDAAELRARIRALPSGQLVALDSVLSQVERGPEVLDRLQRAREAISTAKARQALLALARWFEIPQGPSVEAFLNFAGDWEESPITETGSPGEFLDYLNYFREARGVISLPAEEQGNTVKLMTAHAAKGLEFDHVFILRASTASFPAAYREPLIEFPRALRRSARPDLAEDKRLFEQEERRLFYVAMTRARDSLTLYGPFGKGKRETTPPGYLRELLKNDELRPWLRPRKCREFQSEIFPPAEACASGSRLSEWMHLAPPSDLGATLSASSIERYQVCPLQFKLEREWRIPAEASAALKYGAAMHRALRTYYDSRRSKRELSAAQLIEVLLSDLSASAIADLYQHQLYQQQGIVQLREFVARAERLESEVLHTEEPFSVRIGETNLVGRIDRIDRGSSNGVVITDYKTGKPRSQEDADISLQLSLYALAAGERWGYRAERLVFHNLEGNTTISTERSPGELEAARQLVEEVGEKIRQGDFEPKVGFHCASCAYRTLCPKTEKRIPLLVEARTQAGS